MRIAQVAPLYERVPPLRYGGTERVVASVADELVRRGHAVTVFASGDSLTAADLQAVTAPSLRLDPGATDPLVPHVLELAQVFEQASDFDIIHCHVDYRAFPFARLVRTPTVHTVHGRLDLPHLVPMFTHFRDLPLVSVSDAQRAPLRALSLNWAATIHHGLPLARYRFSRSGGRSLVFVGRISPEKRPDLAITVAKRLGLPLKIAAKVDAADQDYFDREIKPLLAHPLIEFLGELDETDKVELLREALALLFPVDWPEPFGLVMIEAMACGTPVIARPVGSVPEIVLPGRTGLLGDTVDDLVRAVKQITMISRAACRRHVEAHFTVDRMTNGYEAVYSKLVTSSRAA
jgi:glycosyltransferase involved in cell wall biosynthesis